MNDSQTRLPLNLADATQLALAAIEDADWSTLELALAARRQAIASGQQPTPELFDQGEQIATWLRSQIRETRLELCRAEQLNRGFAATVGAQPAYVNFRG